MNKYLLILACSLLAIPAFAQQQQISVQSSQSITIPISGPAMTQPSLLSVPDRTLFAGMENPLNKNKPNGYIGANANGHINWLQIDGVPPFQLALNFTPENILNKDKPNGYLGANALGHLDWSHIDNVPVASKTTSGCLQASDFINFAGMENPLNKNKPNGYLGANALGHLNFGQIDGVPSFENQNNKNKANGYIGANANGHVNFTQVDSVPPFENQANKNAKNGYAGLDANGLISPTALPSTPVQVWNEVYQVPSTPVATYTLANSNVVTTSVMAFHNGLLMTPTVAYSVSGNVVTFVALPNPGDTFVFAYQHQ